MGTVSTAPTNNDNTTTSSTEKNVYLFNWWLIKAENDVNGKRLAVGGFTYGVSKDPQVFSSAPIVKKYDFGTLQTADGVTVYIEGSINKIHSQSTGISSKVCKYFQFGFPWNWDDSCYHCGGDSKSTRTSYLSNDQDIQKDGGTKENWSLLEASSKDSVLQASAECLEQFDDELQKIEDSVPKNSFATAEVVSSTSCGKIDGIMKSSGPFGSRRSSRLINMKKRTDYRQETETNTSNLVSLGSEIVTENQIHCESGVSKVRGSPSTGHHEESNSLDNVTHIGTRGNTILTSPNDGPKISENTAVCDNDTTRGDMVGCDIDNANLSEVSMAALVETANGFGGTEVASITSRKKIDGNNELMRPLEARRSSRVTNMKREIRTRAETKRNKGSLVSMGYDLVTEDELHCECGEKDVQASLSVGPHEKINCLDDVNLTGIEETTILRNDGSKSSEKYPNCYGDATQGDASGYDIDNVNPSKVNRGALVENPNIDLECLSRKDLFENSGGEYLSRCFSKEGTPCSEMDSNKKQTIGARRSNSTNVMENRINNREILESYETLVNVTHDVRMSRGGLGTGDNKLGTSQCKTKRCLDYSTEICTPPISRSKRKKLSLLSPEESSCKRSGSGRLVVPPVDYWRNQQVFYDMNRRIAGVLNGLPLAESCRGSKSEPSRKLKKFL